MAVSFKPCLASESDLPSSFMPFSSSAWRGEVGAEGGQGDAREAATGKASIIGGVGKARGGGKGDGGGATGGGAASGTV